MKKSEIYLQAQIAVITSGGIGVLNKAEILRELMHQEDIAKFCEEKEEEERVAQAV